ncbi:MAG: hypothetical protein WBZ36_05550 [Candidatus Nitrosopolaris sp.]
MQRTESRLKSKTKPGLLDDDTNTAIKIIQQIEKLTKEVNRLLAAE